MTRDVFRGQLPMSVRKRKPELYSLQLAETLAVAHLKPCDAALHT